MRDDVLDLDSFLPYRLNRLAEAVSRDFSTIYRDRFGLSRPEWRVLATLGQFGTMTATAIGAHSAMHKTKVSRAVAELERRRWLTRSPDDADRRIEQLALSKPGLAAYGELVPLAKAFEQRLFRAFGERQSAAVLEALAMIEQAAGIAGGNGRTEA